MNTDHDTGSPKVSCGFTRSLQANSRIVLQVCKGHIFQNPLQFIIYQSSRHSMLHGSDADRITKQTRRKNCDSGLEN